MSEVTVVCCWTNETMYNDFVNTLKAQDTPCEIIGIDNRGNKGFTSCAGAYNSVIDDVKTEYVIFSHQDILLRSSDVLSKFVSYLGKIGHDDILGVAGVRFESPEISGIFSDIKQMNLYTGELFWPSKYRVDGGIMECDTLDECFFGGYTQHFRDYPFDAETCDNWHLYAAEACMKANTKAHARIWVCSTDIIHKSTGNINLSFALGFRKLCRKYANDFPFVRVTCGYSFTSEKGLRRYMLSHVRKRLVYHLIIVPRDTIFGLLHRAKIYVLVRKIYRAVMGKKGREI